MLGSLRAHGSAGRSITIGLCTNALGGPKTIATPALFLYYRRLPKNRSLSSVPPSPEKEKTALHPVPPKPPVNRKVRVELRPSPVKSGDATTRHTAGSTLSVKPQDSGVTGPPSSFSHVPSLPSSVAVTPDVAKHDIEDATKHEILPPPSGANRIQTLFHQVKELIKFYWRGITMIYANKNKVAEIKKRVREGGTPISRWESRFMRRYKDDSMKLIPFIAIVVVVEELIPLIAIYAPFMLPSTCILPSQRDRIENAKRSRQVLCVNDNQPLFRHISTAQSGYVPLDVLRRNPSLNQAMCGLLRLSTFGFNFMRTQRIQRHLEYISEDDELLANEDMGTKLSPLELTEALHERGIITAGFTNKDQAIRLRWWLTTVREPAHGDPINRRLSAVAKNAAGG